MHVFRSGLTAVAVAVVLAVATGGRGQESINHASVSGRVTDGQGGVLPGATVTARQLETDVTADGRDRQRRPLPLPLPAGRRLRADGADGRVHRGAPADRAVGRVGVRDPVRPHRRRHRRRSVTVHGEAPRARIGAQPDRDHRRRRRGREPAAQRPQLPRHRAARARAWRRPTSTARSSSPRRRPCRASGLSVGSQRNLSNSFIVDGLSANDDAAGLSGMPYGVDAVEQFQVVTSGGQAELGPGARRLRQRRHPQRHQPAARHRLRLLPRRRAATPPTRCPGTTLPMSQQQYGASVGGPIAPRPHVLLRERRAAPARSDRASRRSATPTSPSSTRGWRRSATPAQPVTTGTIRQPGRQPEPARQGRSRLHRPRPAERPLQPLRRRLRQLARRRRAQRAVGIAGLDNRDQAVSVSNTLTIGARTVNETRAQFTYSDLLAPPTDPVGPTVNIAGVATFGTFASSPQGRLNKMFQIVDNDRPAARRARAARRRRRRLQRRHASPSRAPCAAPTPSRRWPTSWPAPTTTPGSRQTFGDDRGRPGQHQPRALRAGRVERDAAADPQPRAALRPAVPRDHRHRRQQRVAARRLRLDAVRVARPGRPRQRRAVLRPRAAAGPGQRAAVGRQHHRPGAAPAAEHRACRPGRPARRRSRPSCRRRCRR